MMIGVVEFYLKITYFVEYVAAFVSCVRKYLLSVVHPLSYSVSCAD